MINPPSKIMDYMTQILVKLLKNIKSHLESKDKSKITKEFESLEHHLKKISISAMTAFRIRKLYKLDHIKDAAYIKEEIDKLITILTHLVSWKCQTCNKTIETEHQDQLPLLVTAHEITHRSS